MDSAIAAVPAVRVSGTKSNRISVGCSGVTRASTLSSGRVYCGAASTRGVFASGWYARRQDEPQHFYGDCDIGVGV